MELLRAKQDAVRLALQRHAPLLVAYSGGVDSAYLLAEARHALGREGMLGVIADSPSLPRRALAEALALAAAIDAPVEVVPTGELENPDYAQNPVNRCYFCKAELFANLERMAESRNFRGLAYGENADDMRQVRPGRQAAAEFQVLAPLRDAGLTKEEIRSASRAIGLPTADAPAQPCLSSRIPHGTPVTAQALSMVEAGEEWVRSLGFSVFRVRHIEQEVAPGAGGVTLAQLARVQIAPEEMCKLPKAGLQLEAGLRAVGYALVEIDPRGYRAS
jgi:pyridinium-3,5-biscarboxylic acid mononucleotide sulfurtransferase